MILNIPLWCARCGIELGEVAVRLSLDDVPSLKKKAADVLPFTGTVVGQFVTRLLGLDLDQADAVAIGRVVSDSEFTQVYCGACSH